MSNGTVNARVVDAVNDALVISIGQSAAQSMALLDTVMAETVGMFMHNAVTAQHQSQMLTNAAITTACAKMINAQPPEKSSGKNNGGGNGGNGGGNGGNGGNGKDGGNNAAQASKDIEHNFNNSMSALNKLVGDLNQSDQDTKKVSDYLGALASTIKANQAKIAEDENGDDADTVDAPENDDGDPNS